MPINATPIAGLSDHIDDVRSHTGRGLEEQLVTNGSLWRGPFSTGAPQDAHHVLVAKNVLHHDDKNESWGSNG